MSAKLSNFVKTNFADSKSDLFAVFMEVCHKMNAENGYQAMITQHAWMFLSSFEKLRAKIQKLDIVNMVHLGSRAFEEIGGEVVQTTSFIFANKHMDNYKGTYCRLVEPITQVGKEEMFLAKENRYVACSGNFSEIPGAPVAYWVSENFRKAFELGTSIDSISDFTGSQHKTADNEKYTKLFWEICNKDIDNKAWIFYIKGGEYRKWYGNIDLVVDWRENAKKFYKNNVTSNMIKEKYCFNEGITYTSLTSATNGFRYLPPIGTFDIKGPSIVNVEHQNYCLGFFNTKIANRILKLLNPTITLQVKDVKNTPIIFNDEKILAVEKLVKHNIEYAKSDWDAFETSWDFTKHPLLRNKPTISEAYAEWEAECNTRFAQLKANEEELNRIFIDIYGLQDELTPEVEDKDVTVRKADLQRDIKSLLSYAVGCMFGRYSLDVEGLAYAGGEWDESKYVTFKPDEDNVIPITDEDYFEDDIIGRLIAWLKVVYGAETLEENLRFIADALGTSGDTARQKIRNYFLKDFFKDHCKIYQKRPIYWLYDSGRQNGFKALIYMHRYDADTSGQVRAEYLGKMEETYESEINRMQDIMDNGAGREVALAGKRKEKLQKQLHECRDYDAVLGHIALASIAIDLDDGVKVNYVKVQTAKDGKLLPILAKI